MEAVGIIEERRRGVTGLIPGRGGSSDFTRNSIFSGDQASSKLTTSNMEWRLGGSKIRHRDLQNINNKTAAEKEEQWMVQVYSVYQI